MSFTDEDLRRLKTIIENCQFFMHEVFDDEKLLALLARLEAAEEALQPHKDSCGTNIDAGCTCDLEVRMGVWLKTKGEIE